jgi:F-type H+-transporting ATPase subunit b
MADSSQMNAGTAQPAHRGGFPPFDHTTFPSQIFWLAITFTILLVFMWRVVVPAIGGTLAERRKRIASELAQAEADRREADNAWSTYQTTLIEARERARALVEENRTRVTADVDRQEKAADSAADDAVAKAEARLAQLRAEARGHITRAAEEAAISIVARLTGDSISPEDAAAAVRAVQG